MRRQTKMYMNPAHGARVCQQMLRAAEANGENLCSVEKDYLLGCGVTFRMFFKKELPLRRFRVMALVGKLRDERDPVFAGCRVHAVLSMKALWVTRGYYYYLEEVAAAGTDGAR